MHWQGLEGGTNIQFPDYSQLGGTEGSHIPQGAREACVDLWLCLGGGKFPSARQEVSSGVGSRVHAEERWSSPWLEPGSGAQVWCPGTCATSGSASCSLCDVGEVASLCGWPGLTLGSWGSSETAQSGICDRFRDIFALSRGCLCASSWLHAMLHDSQRVLSIGYSHSTPTAYGRTLHWPAIPIFRFMAAGDSATAHVACLAAAEQQG